MQKPFQTPELNGRLDCLVGLPMHTLPLSCNRPRHQRSNFPDKCPWRKVSKAKKRQQQSPTIKWACCWRKEGSPLTLSTAGTGTRVPDGRKAVAQLFPGLTHRSAANVWLGASPHPWHATPAPLSCRSSGDLCSAGKGQLLQESLR